MERYAELVERGLRMEGELPGGLHVKRRAKELHEKLISRPEHRCAHRRDGLGHALAVNEENAAGGVVTAPTNGAAGIIPRYSTITSALCGLYRRWCPAILIGSWQSACFTKRMLRLAARKRVPRGGRCCLLNGRGRAHGSHGWKARTG